MAEILINSGVATLDSVATPLRNRELLCTQQWSLDELHAVLYLAREIKNRSTTLDEIWRDSLAGKTFLMLFYTGSLRTRVSFEVAAFELGGMAINLSPSMARFRSHMSGGESVEDIANVLTRYTAGIGIRAEYLGEQFGDAHALLKAFSKYCNIPIINMGDDCFHPCQGLADVMGWAEHLGQGYGCPDYETLRGKRLYITWANSALHRSRYSVNEALLIASRFGMNITLAHPPGYDLDDNVLSAVQNNCQKNQMEFQRIDDHERGFVGSDIVYSRNWVSVDAYQADVFQKEEEKVFGVLGFAATAAVGSITATNTAATFYDAIVSIIKKIKSKLSKNSTYAVQNETALTMKEFIANVLMLPLVLIALTSSAPRTEVAITFAPENFYKYIMIYATALTTFTNDFFAMNSQKNIALLGSTKKTALLNKLGTFSEKIENLKEEHVSSLHATLMGSN